MSPEPPEDPQNDSAAAAATDAPSGTRRIGSLLAGSIDAPVKLGRFEVLALLGSGGMGVVYRARDLERGQIVALKTLQRMDAAGLLRLKAEFRTVADIVHPNLVTLYELVSVGDDCFFTMELVDGTGFFHHVRGELPFAALRSAARAIAEEPTMLDSDMAMSFEAIAAARARGEPLDADGIARLREALPQLASGLSALHAAGKLHRDLKPGNVMVARDGRVVVLDFGLATDGRDARQGDDRSGGTPAYMAPEQIRGEPATPASDWYAVGVMLYEALTGRLPAQGSVADILRAKLLHEPEPPSAATPGVPADLDELCLELRRIQPERRPSGAEILRRLGATSAPAPVSARPAAPAAAALLGRDGELEALFDAYRAARAGAPVTVHVHGRSGMGKSALSRWFLDELRREGEALVLEGRCYERESVPFKAFDGLVDALAAHLKGLPRATALALLPEGIYELVRVFPVLGTVQVIAGLPPPPAQTPDPNELQRRAFRALKALLARVARERPLVLCIDDLQWGDRDSARLLDELAAPPDCPPVLLVCTYRSEEIGSSPVLRDLVARPASPREVREIAVGPLSPEQASGLALSILGREDDAARRRAAAIAREAENNPFFVEQLVRYAEAGGGAAPEVSLDGLVVARLGQLPPDARRLLEIVAVAGRPVAQGVAIAAARRGADPRAAMALLRSGSLVRTRGVRDDDPVECFHDRIRESVFAHLDAAVRAAHHGRLAAALEERSADPEELAVHFHGAGHVDKGRRYAVAAADKAAAGLAFDRAAELYGLALECEPAPAERAGLWTKRADALVHAGRCAEAAPLYLSAAAAARGAAAIDLRRRAAEQLLVSGRIDEGVGVLGPVLAEVGLSFPKTPRRALLAAVARIVQLELRGTGFEARREDEVPADALRRLDVCWSAGKGLLSVDSIRAANFLVHTLLLALAAGEPRRIARMLAIYGMMTVYEGAPSGFRKGTRLLEQARRIAEPLGDPYLDGTIGICEGTARMTVGQWREGLGRMEAGIQLLEERCAGVAWECATARGSCFTTRVWLGELRHIAREAPRWQREGEGVGDLFAAVNAELYRAIPCLAGGDPAGARAMVRRAIGRWSSHGFHFQHWIALKVEIWCDLYEGEVERAWRRLDEAWRPLEGSHLLRVQLMLLDALLLRAQTAVLSSPRHPGRLRVALRDADALDRLRRETATGAARLIKGAVSAARGDRAAAVGELDAAIAAFDAVDVALHAASARRRKGELVGGERGRALVAEADERLRAEGIADPARWAAIYAAGGPGAAPPR